MKVELQSWIKKRPNEVRSIFQCISFDYEKMQRNLEGESAADVAYYLKEMSEGMIMWPNGIFEILRYFENPMIVIGARYNEKLISEKEIASFLKEIGINVSVLINPDVLKAYESYKERELAMRDFMQGKIDKLPSGNYDKSYYCLDEE